MKPTIKWNADLFGVEIKTKEEHFVIDANPSMVMSWHDAVRYFNGNEVWQLPTQKQLEIVAGHIEKVNALIKDNGGYEIRSWHRTADGCGEFYAWLVGMPGGIVVAGHKLGDYYVRAVSDLKVK